MPTVGGKRFPYTPSGKRAAKKFSQKIGKPLTSRAPKAKGLMGKAQPSARAMQRANANASFKRAGGATVSEAVSGRPMIGVSGLRQGGAAPIMGAASKVKPSGLPQGSGMSGGVRGAKFQGSSVSRQGGTASYGGGVGRTGGGAGFGGSTSGIAAGKPIRRMPAERG